MSKNMRAVVIEQFGNENELKLTVRPQPIPLSHQVQIEIK